ncbi:MAG: sensor histidine kinase [Alkalibacterium sp.]|nr:sensor histidine kinase [Alkalibacterium sp.]
MTIIDYMKERFVFLASHFILFIILSLVILLLNINAWVIAGIFCFWFIPLLMYMFTEFIKAKRFFDELEDVVDHLDRKYLVAEMMKTPEFIEGKLLFDVLKRANKDMHEHVNLYRDRQSGHREYIETWVHEIKTPIASTRLIIDNNESKVTKNIEYEMKKVESFIEQILFYSKSNDAYKDYIVKELSLKPIVHTVIKNNSRDFINKKIAVHIGNIESNVYSDGKWLEFIINQIIGNAVKYCTPQEGLIKIDSTVNANNVVLSIEDNGIGIADYDLSRVFEKGFTGENGRIVGQSTGIGLYLCKELCEKLGLGLNIDSEKGEGTKVSIIFPIGKV